MKLPYESEVAFDRDIAIAANMWRCLSYQLQQLARRDTFNNMTLYAEISAAVWTVATGIKTTDVVVTLISSEPRRDHDIKREASN